MVYAHLGTDEVHNLAIMRDKPSQVVYFLKILIMLGWNAVSLSQTADSICNSESLPFIVVFMHGEDKVLIAETQLTLTLTLTHSFPLRANARQRRTKKIKRVPNSISGTPKKPMEVPRPLEYKTLGKLLQSYPNQIKFNSIRRN